MSFEEAEMLRERAEAFLRNTLRLTDEDGILLHSYLSSAASSS
ncbi:MAG: hypothetical protein ACUVTD_08505 [Nitrososphaerales archaeon]